jgi:hypothetical protein
MGGARGDPNGYRATAELNIFYVLLIEIGFINQSFYD